MIAAFSIKLQAFNDPVVAEAMAVREGLRSLLANGLRAGIVETDSQIVARAINGDMLVSVIDSIVFDTMSLLFNELGGGTHVTLFLN